MAEERKKKVVRVESTTPAAKSGATGAAADAAETVPNDWKPTPEAKKQATTFRIIAAVLWALAIGTEIFAIFWVLRQDPINMVLLIILLVVIGGLALGGSMLWKKANRLDPASNSDKFRFFVQNQLGAIITVIAFLPLIVLIFLNKDMSGKQKGLAGGIAIALLVAVGALSADYSPPSTEQYSSEAQTVVDITGQDLVFWTKSGKVFHLCADASAVNQDSKDNQIYSGTVADAHAAGKERLTLQVDQEIKQCGFAAPASSDAPADSETPAAEESATPAP